MKAKLFLLLFSLSFFTVCFAQENDSKEEAVEPVESDKSSVIYDGATYNFIFSWKKKQEYDPHWCGLGMAFTGFSELEGVALASSSSYSIVLNPIEYYLPIYHNCLFVTGIGFDWSRYHFKGDIGLQDNGLTTDFVLPADDIHYKDSKLLAYYLTLPLLLEYQKKVSKHKEFFISGGIVGYVKCYSKSQVKYDTGRRVDLGRDLNIPAVNARFMLQIGIEDVSIFGYYSPFSIIEKGKGAELKPMGIGLMLEF